jgi:PAS domain S-box-containing protein
MSRPAAKSTRAVVVVVVALTGAVLVRWLLTPLVGHGLPFLTPYLAAVGAAATAGPAAGIATLVLGWLAGDGLFSEPRLALIVGPMAVRGDAIRYLVVGAVTVGVIGWLRRARDSAVGLARQAADARERLRVTLSSIGDGVIVTDVDGRITSLNPVAEELTGWPSAAAAGRPLAEVYRIVDAITRAPVENPAARALTEGRRVGLGSHTILVSRDGTERPIDDSAAPINEEHGSVVGSVLVFRDMSDRYQAERIRQWDEERFRLVVHAANDSVWDYDFATGNVWRNEIYDERFGAKSTGVESAWQWWEERIHPDDRGAVTAGLRAAIDGTDERWSADYRFRRRDGTYAFVSERAYITRTPTGQAERILGVMRDVTEQKQHQEALEAADRRKTEFLATLAHELRNPLNPIKNAVEILRLKGERSAELVWGREVIDRQVDYLTRLIDDLMDVSRITRGKLGLRKTRVELAAVLGDAIESSRSLVDEHDHRLHLSLPPDPIPLDADAVRLAQVFMNLINNAAKYTPPGGNVWVDARLEGGQAIVSVRDDGIGLDCDEIPRLFEMFFQSDRTRERTQGGLGIGLTLCKQLVEMHGGKIEVRSEGHGRGCEFVVTLPAAVDAEIAVAPPARVEPIAGRKILVVDDNYDSAASLAMLLELGGNSVEVAHDGLEAIGAAGTFRPDLVLLDIGMPLLDGYETCRRIRGEPWGREMLIVAQTGWGQDDDRKATREAGFDGHLVKPVDHLAVSRLLASLGAANGRPTA